MSASEGLCRGSYGRAGTAGVARVSRLDLLMQTRDRQHDSQLKVEFFQVFPR